MTRFTPGQRVFVVTAPWPESSREGYYATVDRVTPSGRTYIGSDVYGADGRGWGNTVTRIRERRDGDDAAVQRRRARLKDEKAVHETRNLAWTIAGVNGNQWATLPREQLDIVAGILRGAGVIQ